MHSADLMFAIAQIAIALAGFSAIIVALNQKPIREWGLMDQINIRLLIQVSIQVVFFSLTPSLLAISLPVSDVWLYSLWAYGLVHLVDVSFFLFLKSKHAPTIFRVAAACGFIVGLVQVALAWFGGDIARESVYVFTLIWHLGIIFMAFILLLYQMGHTEEVTDNSGSTE